MRPLVLASLASLAACRASDHFLIVEVSAPPAVHGASSLTVALSNDGSSRTDSLPLHGERFPVTFSLSAPGRTGDLAIDVSAIDAAGLVVGHGSGTAKLSDAHTSLALDTTDFVVNTDFAGDQFPSDDFEANGFQLAALPDGTWTAVFRDSCMDATDGTGCNIFARRFDATGAPVTSVAAAGTNAFTVNSTVTTSSSIPAVASGAATTLTVWDAANQDFTAAGVACRAIDPTGQLSPAQTSVAPDDADVVSIAALDTGNFVASWSAFSAANDSEAIHAVVIKPDCTTASAVLTVSTIAGFAERSAVAASGAQVLFTWLVDGNVHIRLASSAGAFAPADVDNVLIPKTATDEVESARVAPASNGGFVLALRWADTAATGAGRIEIYQLSSAGAIVAGPTLVTDRSDNEFNNEESFALASRPDGSVLVAWHTCGALGDSNLCGVFGRFHRETGEPLADSFTIPTTTIGDQQRPSVVGLPDAFAAIWADSSGQPPDTSGQAVRARILYPPAAASAAAP